MLPTAPPGYGGSPYDGRSAFAGDPSWIDPHGLVEIGLLTEQELKAEKQESTNWNLEYWLRKAWSRYQHHPTIRAKSAIESFLENPKHRCWLEDWVLYSALKERRGSKAWYEWPTNEASRKPDSLSALRRELSPAIEYQRFLQALFSYQWTRLRAYANRAGILLLGDLPFYVATDSADVWKSRTLFQVGASGLPTQVAGVPPDAFCPEGQLWGLPIYNWGLMADSGYRWWIDRLTVQLERFDLLRLDHFRGLVDYWGVPSQADSSAEGQWYRGPGEDFLKTLQRNFARLPLIAEDLGEITPEVERLRDQFDLPGMRVLQFGFDSDDSPHHPDRIPEFCVAYTGTHDNPPTKLWYRGLNRRERTEVRRNTHGSGFSTHRDLVRCALSSQALLSVVPMQDILGLGPEAVMNRPGTAEGNWSWTLDSWPAPKKTQWFRELVQSSGRCPVSRP